MALKPVQYKTQVHNDWCPGCGDFGILSALQVTLAEMGLEPDNVAVFSGIGCSGKTPHYINAYGIHTLHGRVLPYAIGAKLANPKMHVLAVGGDGDGLGIGAGHFVSAGRRNVDMTYIIHNNGVYGLTKGQASPTLKLGLKTKSIPKPNMNEDVNPIALALAAGYTFIARAYAYEGKYLKEVFKKAITHKGLSFVDVLQPCVTYNDIYTKAFFGGEDLIDPTTGKPTPRVYKLEEEGYDPVVHDPQDEEGMQQVLLNAIIKSREWGVRIPLGVFYQNEHVPTYGDRISNRMPHYSERPPGQQRIAGPDGAAITNINKLIEELKVTSKSIETDSL